MVNLAISALPHSGKGHCDADEESVGRETSSGCHSEHSSKLPGRWLQCLLLSGGRAVSNAVRLSLAPLAVFIAVETNLTALEQGHIIGAFALGYMCTQVLGGMLADMYGGKHPQTAALLVSGCGFVAVPNVMETFGPSGLFFLSLIMGFVSGVQHPASNAMVAAWFQQDELGKATSYTELGTVVGQLTAAGIMPVLASFFGWRNACIVIGFVDLAFTMIWLAFAQSSHGNTAAEESDSMKRFAVPPRSLAMRVPVLAVIFQHSCYNGSKYFFSSWMPYYFKMTFGMLPDAAGLYISPAYLIGIVAPMVWAAAEEKVLAKTSILVSRRFFAAVAFTCNCATIATMIILHRSGLMTPGIMSALLCFVSFWMTAHSFGFKANYNDLTVMYAGLFMGVGNTFATLATYVIPVATGYAMAGYGDQWPGVFMGIACLDVFGALVGVTFTAVSNLDAKEGSRTSSSVVTDASSFVVELELDRVLTSNEHNRT
jgi:MFS family permease